MPDILKTIEKPQDLHGLSEEELWSGTPSEPEPIKEEPRWETGQGEEPHTAEPGPPGSPPEAEALHHSRPPDQRAHANPAAPAAVVLKSRDRQLEKMNHAPSSGMK